MAAMTKSAPQPNVQYIREELLAVLDDYRRIADCLRGAKHIKAMGDEYLPRPNPSDFSKENQARYDAYLKRAVFYNVLRRTVQGLVGQVFARDPISEIPDQMDKIEIDATGTGLSLAQTSKKMLNYALAYSRGGVAVDYPSTNGNVTVAEMEKGHIRPVVTVYSPETIINWRTMKRGAETVLSMVVVAEAYPFADDGFEVSYGCQFRVMRLVPAAVGEKVNRGGEYRLSVEVWREDDPTAWDGSAMPSKEKVFQQAEIHHPTLPNGELFDEIPFLFFGSENNDIDVDRPFMADMAELNIAHYRNSADYEEACYVMGQPTYVATGLTTEWYTNVLKGVIPLGSWGGVPLGEGMDLKLVQGAPNAMPYEAMQHKENQMVALGAKLVENKKVQRTATEAVQDASSESSILSSAANNVSAAMRWALNWCARFMDIKVPEDGDGSIKYELNTDFGMMNLTPEERKALIAEFQGGGITWSEWRKALRHAGIAHEDDKTAKAEIESAEDDELNKAVDEAKRMQAIQPKNPIKAN